MLCYGYLNYLFIYDVGLGREQVADCGSHFPAAVLIDCRENKPPQKKKANKKSECKSVDCYVCISLPALNRHFGFGQRYAVSIRSNKLLGKCLPSRGIFQAIERPGWMDGWLWAWMVAWLDGWLDGWSCCPRRGAIPTEAGTAMTSQMADKWSRAGLKGMSNRKLKSRETKWKFLILLQFAELRSL